MSHLSFAKVLLLFVVIMPLSGCTFSKNESSEHSSSTTEETEVEPQKQHQSKAVEQVGLKPLSDIKEKPKQARKFKYSINKQTFFSDSSSLLVGSKLVDQNYQAWIVQNTLTISFYTATKLDLSWQQKLASWQASSHSLDQIHHQIKFDSRNNDLYKIYQQIKQNKDVEQVEIQLTIVPNNQVETH